VEIHEFRVAHARPAILFRVAGEPGSLATAIGS
jgi:hypothetical protein